jgi:HK97 gp10 family phage protein
MTVDLDITGLAELLETLGGLPDKMMKGSIRSGLRQGANVVRNQARANFNTAGGPNELTGALKASIRVTQRRGTADRVVFNVVAGTLTSSQTKKFGTDSAYYALWVERGHINRKLGQALRGSKLGILAARAASTSNTPAHPYMRPAIEQKAQAAIDVMVETITNNLAADVK